MFMIGSGLSIADVSLAIMIMLLCIKTEARSEERISGLILIVIIVVIASATTIWVIYVAAAISVYAFIFGVRRRPRAPRVNYHQEEHQIMRGVDPFASPPANHSDPFQAQNYQRPQGRMDIPVNPNFRRR